MFTHSERFDKKYTVLQAIESARRRLKGTPMCMDKIRNRELTEKITLVELNEISDKLVDDSIYWNG